VPVFGTPVVVDAAPAPPLIVLGAVDGKLRGVEVGEEVRVVWEVDAGAGPLFAPLVLYAPGGPASLPTSVLVGGHDGSVRCVRLEDRGVLWSSVPPSQPGNTTLGPVTGMALAFMGNTARLCAVSTSNGHLLLLDVQTGLVRASIRASQERVCGPLVLEQLERLVVGCRDDHVYALDVRPRKKEGKEI
jgi:outer membrane protein assembly factor BamB